MAHKVTRDELIEHLREQLGFLARSAGAYDGGCEDEAKRLATVIRVMVHDTGQSKSVLSQLQLKNSLRYIDSAEQINPNNLLATPGLVMGKIEAGAGGSYVPPLANISPLRQNPPKQFKEWWTDVVTVGPGFSYSRREYVLIVANKEGGSHVDPELNQEWVAWTRQNLLGWLYGEGETEPQPFEGDLGLASVRQIAWELETTVREQLKQLLAA